MLALIGIIYAAFAPLPFDPLLPQEKWGAGASSVLPAHSGLQREFPALNGDTSPEKNRTRTHVILRPNSLQGAGYLLRDLP